MTRKLEDLLNLPDSKQLLSDDKKIKKISVSDPKDTLNSIAEFDKIAAALPTVDGLGKMADVELNEIADKAMQAYDDLMDLGMNVESRYSGRIFEVANSMLHTSLDAKVAKLDKKLKMVELQLKKQKLDQSTNELDFTEGQGFVVSDRNSLLERLKGLNKDK